jgi:hypothetical protein
LYLKVFEANGCSFVAEMDGQGEKLSVVYFGPSEIFGLTIFNKSATLNTVFGAEWSVQKGK